MSEKIIEEFEEMINEVCGPKSAVKLARKGRPKGTRPTPDFYDLPLQHEDFMQWYKEKTEERYYHTVSIECSCGEKYIVQLERDEIVINYPFWSETGTETGTETSNEYYQNVRYEKFFCYKCGKPFVVTGNKIRKIKSKSKQLEVVL